MNIETLKKALGKKRLAKIEYVNFWPNYERRDRVELIMKAPFIDDSAETVVDEERDPDYHLTQKEWINHIKWRVDLMEFDPEGWNDCWSTVPYENLTVVRSGWALTFKKESSDYWDDCIEKESQK